MKTRFFIIFVSLLAAGTGFAADTNSAPPFDEVYQLLRAHLRGTTDADLNQAAVQGLLAQLSSTAMLVDADAPESTNAERLGKPVIYDDGYAYFPVLKVQAHLADDLMAAWKELSATNKSKINGVVLDLRFASGADFMAAAATADCFLNSNQPLLECGGQIARSTQKDDSITVPLAVLINSKTSEAAEGLAAVLHETHTGLLLGSQTAGRANLFQEFPLAEGSKLRIAVGEIKLADGSVFAGSVQPDIAVEVNAADEMAYWLNPYRNPAQAAKPSLAGTNVDLADRSATNGGTFRRLNEAELVKEHRDGADLEAAFNASETSEPAPEVKTINDPTLSRALDLLKGLAVIQQSHPG